MGEMVLVLGGARSGKSSFALKMCSGRKGRKAFIATAVTETLDEEMKARVEAHKREREAETGWENFEETADLPGLIERTGALFDVILIDCLTLWLSNLLIEKADMKGETARLLKAIKGAGGAVCTVSNEVGMGVVPETPLGRAFRDEAGRLNQLAAAAADRVYLVTAGIANRIK